MVHPIVINQLIPGVREIPGHTFFAGIAFLFVIAFAFRANRQLAVARAAGTELLPDEKLTARNAAELFVGFIQSLGEGVLGTQGRRYTSLFGTFFLFILVSNFLGLVPGFSPPTGNFQTTLALGFASFVAFNYIGIRDQGLLKYLAHFAGPIWWLAVLMFPLELVGTMVRPFSLGLRLFGNMTGDHLVLEIFTGLTKLGIPIVFYFFGTLVSVLQAFVFTLLTIIYVSLSVGHDDHHAHDH
jgi:F-type H+-transporting ATPase subunit a